MNSQAPIVVGSSSYCLEFSRIKLARGENVPRGTIKAGTQFCAAMTLKTMFHMEH